MLLISNRSAQPVHPRPALVRPRPFPLPRSPRLPHFHRTRRRRAASPNYPLVSQPKERTMSANAKPNEIALTRLYNAPVKAVWDAWIDPAQVAQWWGPRGFSITTKHKHVRPGATWEYTMHGPDGVDYPNIATYHEVEPLRPSRRFLPHSRRGGRPSPPAPSEVERAPRQHRKRAPSRSPAKATFCS